MDTSELRSPRFYTPTKAPCLFACDCVSVNLADEARMRLQPRMRERLVVLGQCCLFTLVFMGHPEEAGAAGEAGGGG